MRTPVGVVPVTTHDPAVGELVRALTTELAEAGYSDEESFGYGLEQLEAAGVHLVGASTGDALVGLGGLEIDGTTAELKRFYVVPDRRGSGVADALLDELVDLARAHGVRDVVLETGDQQHAAMAFYRRRGFAEIPRFGPYLTSATSICFALRL